MANEHNLIPAKKGEVRNPHGRPKKYTTLLREQGYKLSEINDTIQVMMQMTVDELKEVWDNKNATVLEKTIAAAIRKSIEKGSLYSIETLLTRVYGKPKENADIKSEINMNAQITKVEPRIIPTSIPLASRESDVAE